MTRKSSPLPRDLLLARASQILLRRHTAEERESAYVMVECAKELRVGEAAIARALEKKERDT